MAALNAAEIMCAEIKTPMNFNKTTEFGARRKKHLYSIPHTKSISITKLEQLNPETLMFPEVCNS
jgi:hypothetical protein